MLFKRTAFAMALAAALLTVAPVAPAASEAPATLAVKAQPPGADVSDFMPGQPAWGYYYTSKNFNYYRFDPIEGAMFGGIANVVCVSGAYFLASGPAGGAVWGLSCGFAAVA